MSSGAVAAPTFSRCRRTGGGRWCPRGGGPRPRAPFGEPARANAGSARSDTCRSPMLPCCSAHRAGLYQPGAVSPGKPVMFRSWAALAEGVRHRPCRRRPPADADGRPIAATPWAVGCAYWAGTTPTDRRSLWRHIAELSDLAGSQVAIPFWWSIHNIVLQQLPAGARVVARGAAQRIPRRPHRGADRDEPVRHGARAG